MNLVLILRFVALAFSFLSAAAPQDWPRFRGPNGTGSGDSASLPAAFSAEANLIWKTPLPPGHSSPVLAGPRIFLTAVEGDRLYVIAVNRATGAIEWRAESPRPRKEALDRRNSAASATPAADSSALYSFFPDFGLMAHSFEGKELWRTPLGPFDNLYGMGSSPIVAGESIILVCDQTRDSFIAAFDRRTGRQRWRTPRPDAVSGHSTPILWQPPGQPLQIIAPGSYRLDAYSAATGESLWHVGGLASEMKSVPVLDNGTIYINGYNLPDNDPGKQVKLDAFDAVLAVHDRNRDGRLSRSESPEDRTKSVFPYLDANHDGLLDTAEWELYARSLAAENGLLAIRPGGRGDVTASNVLWKYHRGIPQLPSTVIHRGVLFMVNDSGILTTLDPSSGAAHKQARIPGGPDTYYASPVAADGKVYFVSRNCRITAISGPQQELIATSQLDGECYATPAIAAGRFYVRTTGALYCFGASTR